MYEFEVLALIILAISSAHRAQPSWNDIAPDLVSRDALLKQKLSSYSALKEIPNQQNLWPVYQLGFEDELYYALVPVIGEFKQALPMANIICLR